MILWILSSFDVIIMYKHPLVRKEIAPFLIILIIYDNKDDTGFQTSKLSK